MPRLRSETAQFCKSIQYSCPDMQLIPLALKGVRHHSLAQSLDAVHLGFHQASPVVVAPFFSDSSPQPLACSNRCIAMFKDATFANTCILSRRSDWGSSMLNYGFIDWLYVIGSIARQTLKRVILR